MSTNSNIRIRRKDGTETGIYCHWDGYIEGVGVTLQLAYNTAEKVEKLLKLGDLSSLGLYTEPNENEPHDFEHRQPNVCVAYHRDRGEEYRQSKRDDAYIYTFDEYQAVWIVTTDEKVRNTPAAIHLGLGTLYLEKEALLLDEILRAQPIIDDPSFWKTDEFAESGKVTEACKAKAKEARLKIIEEDEALNQAYYEAYCL